MVSEVREERERPEVIWALGPSPGTLYLAAYCADRDEYDLVVRQSADGVLRFDGQPASVRDEGSDRDALFVRFVLDEPFRMPPLVIRFEDETVAAAIDAAGWHVFEGRLYRATLRARGEVLLDQVFPTEPPPGYLDRLAERGGVTGWHALTPASAVPPRSGIYT